VKLNQRYIGANITALIGEPMRKKFDVHAGCHGGAGIALIVMLGAAGIITMYGLESRQSIAMALLVASISYAVAMAIFGFYGSVNRE
jgi:hypothetical protein